jgi:hypothetical protein
MVPVLRKRAPGEPAVMAPRPIADRADARGTQGGVPPVN